MHDRIIDKNWKPTAKEDRKLTRRNRIVALEHHIDKLHSELRSAMGFCVKVMDNNPFETDFHQLQNDAGYLYGALETLLDEWQDSTKENNNCDICGDYHEDNIPLSCQNGDGE